jgi:hypothetical protein
MDETLDARRDAGECPVGHHTGNGRIDIGADGKLTRGDGPRILFEPLDG